MKSRDIQGLAEKYEFSMKQVKSLLKRFKAEAGGNNSKLEHTKLLCLPEFLSNPVASAFLCRYFEENSTENLDGDHANGITFEQFVELVAILAPGTSMQKKAERQLLGFQQPCEDSNQVWILKGMVDHVVENAAQLQLSGIVHAGEGSGNKEEEEMVLSVLHSYDYLYSSSAENKKTDDDNNNEAMLLARESEVIADLRKVLIPSNSLMQLIGNDDLNMILSISLV
eukprot:CAMPEP_0206375308 /NCGR_PEP_ID=MMETSP0294-20121207/8806_1 /ASSEMBLY_ACC=CAM_ASM_000327 /TAXON_ID=39354 /ORGANISM="Heterosigma akashiwo, Strain CCMP2393" /LENGTH=225 /DNA_ID=CAMNT_0053823211 /DNA_START=64 /DNA_END=741 /DNA_ORIENTATION=+